MTTLDTGPRDAATQATPRGPETLWAPGQEGVLIGEVRATAPLQVDYPGNPGARPRAALATVPIAPVDVGRRVVLSFVDGDPLRPVVLGFLQGAPMPTAAPALEPIETRVDGKRIVLAGKEQVELRCGEASIVLTRDGKVSIHGVTITSQAKRANKIRGGSIQLN